LKLLEQLFKQDHHYINTGIARNPKTPVEFLETLAKSHHWDVRREVVENPNAPKYLLEILAKDDVHWVRCSVAANPNTPKAVLEILAKDKSEDVLKAIANRGSKLHKQSEFEIYDKKTLSENLINEGVVNETKTSPWFITQLRKAPKEVQKAVAENDILYFCGKDENKAVLSKWPLGKILALSSGTHIVPERIARVSKSTDWLIRAAVARNLGTPPNILKRLTEDTHSLVAALAKHTQDKLSRVK